MKFASFVCLVPAVGFSLFVLHPMHDRYVIPSHTHPHASDGNKNKTAKKEKCRLHVWNECAACKNRLYYDYFHVWFRFGVSRRSALNRLCHPLIISRCWCIPLPLLLSRCGCYFYLWQFISCKYPVIYSISSINFEYQIGKTISLCCFMVAHIPSCAMHHAVAVFACVLCVRVHRKSTTCYSRCENESKTWKLKMASLLSREKSFDRVLCTHVHFRARRFYRRTEQKKLR